MNDLFAMAYFSGGNGEGLVKDMFTLLIVGICLFIVWGLGYLLATKAFKVANTSLAIIVWTGLFVLVAAIAVVNFLLSLIGHGFIAY